MKTRTAADPRTPRATSPRGQFQKVGECLYRHKSSKIYYAWLKRAGKQFRKSLKTSDREVANRKLRDLRAMLSQAYVPQNNKVAFSSFADEWLAPLKGFLKPRSFLRRQDAVKHLKRHFCDTLLIDIRAVAQRCRSRCERWKADVS